MEVKKLREKIEENIEEYVENFREEHDESNFEKEKEMRELLEEKDHLSKEELKDCIQWKMQNQGGRATKNVERLEEVDNEVIMLLTEAVFKTDNPKTQVKLLSSLPGVGSATATAVLAFYDPQNYAVGDRYMNSLFLYNGEEKGVTPGNYPKLLEKLEELRPEGYSLREVEKACYIKYRENR